MGGTHSFCGDIDSLRIWEGRPELTVTLCPRMRLFGMPVQLLFMKPTKLLLRGQSHMKAPRQHCAG